MNFINLIVCLIVCKYSCTGAAVINRLGASSDPLILTPLIRSNKLEEARYAAQVKSPIFKNVSSYSGYLTVNEQFNSNLFFWFFPSEGNPQNDPVLLWLQGGPGSSSMLGLFAENGPFEFNNKSELELREFRWTKRHSVIYIDNPVGTGFSFTDEGGFAKNETIIGAQLFEALQQFFTLFPALQKNRFFVTGESYAGKYVPAISHTILKKNPEAKIKINLEGLAIGNGLCDPINQLKYGEYMFQLGLIDLNTKKVIEDLEIQAVKYIKNHQYEKAFEIFHTIIYENDENNTIFREKTGFQSYYNYLHSENTMEIINRNLRTFLGNPETKKVLHVGNKSFDSAGVEKHMEGDIMKSVAPWISELLSKTRVLFYNGQLDIIIGYPLTVNFLKHLEYDSSEEYRLAERHKWYVDNDLAGYIKQAGNLTEVLVRNAGHLVPGDQPKWSFELISKFVRNDLKRINF